MRMRLAVTWPNMEFNLTPVINLSWSRSVPLYSESTDEAEHRKRRDKTAAFERDLCEAMRAADYHVLNSLPCRIESDPAAWAIVRAFFGERFPRLKSE
jgi:hypothetical protein